MRKQFLSQIGISLIFIGVFISLIGLILVSMGKNAIIEANKDAIDALEDNDNDDYIEAQNDYNEGLETEMIGNFVFGSGFIIAFSGIAFYFLITMKDTPLGNESNRYITLQTKQQTQKDNEMISCINCKKLIPKDSRFCPYCQCVQSQVSK